MTAITMNGNCWIEQPNIGYHGEPFRWDEVRRAQVRAELDAYYARLYGLTRDELRYTHRVDPKEVCLSISFLIASELYEN